MTEQTYCCYPDCESGKWTQKDYDFPLCYEHARKAWLELQHAMSMRVGLNSNPLPDPHALVRDDRRTERELRGGAEQPGFVYFARAGELIKIGYSTNPVARVRSLQATLLVAVPGTFDDEKAMHHRFGEFWDHGEYFTPGGPLVQFIDSLRS